MLTVIGVDPGGTTGWSVVGLDEDAFKLGERALNHIVWFNHGQFTGDEMCQVDELLELVTYWPNSPIVIESFTMRTLAADLSPVRITNGFEYGLRVGGLYIEDFEPGPIFKQSPSLAKTTVRDDRLKAWGFDEQLSGSPHAKDATRHTLTFIRRAKADLNLARRAWPCCIEQEMAHAN